MMVIAARLERVVSDVLPDLSSECDAMFYRVTEMHAAIHACIDHLVDQLIRAVKGVSRSSDSTGERQANPAGTEVVSQDLSHCTGDAAVSGWIFRVWRCRHDRGPRRIGF